MIWILCCYMWFFIHRPFEIWPLFGTLRVERVLMLTILVCWTCYGRKTWIRNRLNFAFLLLGISVVLAAVFSPYPSESGLGSLEVQHWLKVTVFYILLITLVRDERQLKTLVVAFVAFFGLYLLHSLVEFCNGRHWYRMGIVRMLGVDKTYSHPNTFGNSVVYVLPMVYPVWLLAGKNWHRLALIGFVLLCITCVLLTGSRSSFAGIVFVAMAFAVFTRRRVAGIAVVAIIAAIAWGALSGSLRDRYMTLIDSSRGPANARYSAQGRLTGLQDGLRLWTEYPMLGVGPGAFGVARANLQGMSAHNLYGQVAGELGTLGILALTVILIAITRNFFEARRVCRVLAGPDSQFLYGLVASVSLAIACHLLLGWGGHNMYRYTWLWYGAFQAAALHFLRQRAWEAEEQEDWVSSNIQQLATPV